MKYIKSIKNKRNLPGLTFLLTCCMMAPILTGVIPVLLSLGKTQAVSILQGQASSSEISKFLRSGSNIRESLQPSKFLKHLPGLNALDISVSSQQTTRNLERRAWTDDEIGYFQLSRDILPDMGPAIPEKDVFYSPHVGPTADFDAASLGASGGLSTPALYHSNFIQAGEKGNPNFRQISMGKERYLWSAKTVY
ncbi:hypothetical protein K7432_011600 [Basidiobolus ranarum]|uniref:Uncharacterized protein n=1 Tax=Basidiobolus ranarum TaxID=34480 RepID=A0ABR2WM54_9FUNG